MSIFYSYINTYFWSSHVKFNIFYIFCKISWTPGPMCTCVPWVMPPTRNCKPFRNAGEDWIFDPWVARGSRCGECVRKLTMLWMWMGRSSQWGFPSLSVKWENRSCRWPWWEIKVFIWLSKVAVGFLLDMAGRYACEDKEIRITWIWSLETDCWKERGKGRERPVILLGSGPR